MAGAGTTGNTLTVSDDKGDTFNVSNANHEYSTAAFKLVTKGFYATSVVGGSTVVTCTVTDNTEYQGCNLIEFSGASVLDQTQVGDNPSTQMSDVTSGATSTTTAANEILVGACELKTTGNALAATGSWTLAGTEAQADQQWEAEYQVVSATGTYAATFAETDRDTVCNIATFKASGGATIVGSYFYRLVAGMMLPGLMLIVLVLYAAFMNTNPLKEKQTALREKIHAEKRS